MMKYLHEAQINPRHTTRVSDATSPHIDDSDKAILRALEELLFSSIRQLSRAKQLSKTVVYRWHRASSPMGARYPVSR
jgi:hypothetical protein